MQSYFPVSHGLLSLAVVLAACSGDKDGTDDTDTGETPALEAMCTEQTPPVCIDEMISDLSLHDDKVSTREVTDTIDGADFVTAIDATAGGFDAASQNPWVYVKFTEDGAVRVDIDDETALESLDWDLAARRFILRLNGGTSGPSCVGAMPLLERSYDELTEVPGDALYSLDNFYSEDCTIINDASGLPDSPQVALSPWWSYETCVETTGNPFLVQLADGHVIKLRVEQYYGTGQEDCNTTGTTGGDSANFVLRWTFLQ